MTLELKNRQVRLWNKGAKSDNTFPLSDLRGVELKKPGFGRGWIALRTKDRRDIPSGAMGAVNHPRAVLLAMGEWEVAKEFAQLLNDHLAEKRASGELASEHSEDPYAGVEIRGRKSTKLLEAARGHLDLGEKVLAYVLGQYETEILGSDSIRTGVFLATDRRLLFFAKKLTGFDLESFPYEKISSLEMGKGMMGHYITFFASGNKAKMKWIDVGDVTGFVESARARMDLSSKPVSDPTALDPIAQIEKLAALRDAGALSEEEFAVKKADLLSRI